MYGDLPAAPAIDLSVADTNRLLGLDLDAATIAGHLSGVEFEVTPGDDDRMVVQVPSFRC